MVEFAIETVDLVKRYPASVKRMVAGRGGHTVSLRGILELLIRRGAFITALNGVSLQVKKGEIFGLLGPNGAGKTTFIHVLCTLILHDEGEAYVNGFDVQREPRQVLKNLQAVISGNPGFEWRLTARQGLEFYASLYGLSRREANKKIDDLLRFTGLKEREDDMYQKFSGGMRRKLVICRALLQDVPILLLDEPTIGLDPSSSAEIRALLHDRLSREDGKTILITTHNMWEAQEICDRIAILYRGKIIACDTPDNIRNLVHPETIYSINLQISKFSKTHEKMLEELRGMTGVRNLIPLVSTEGTLEKLTLHLDKNYAVSEVLKALLAHGMGIRSIETREPALEEAFIALTREELRK